MSWLSTAWNVGIDLNVIGNLAAIRQNTAVAQQMSDEMKAAAMALLAKDTYLDYLKDEICAVRQAVEQLQSTQFSDRKQEAIAYELLYSLVQRSAIDPSYFSNLYDKDYIATTTRMLRMQRNKLKKEFSYDGWYEIQFAANHELGKKKEQLVPGLQAIFGDGDLADVLTSAVAYGYAPPFVQAATATVYCTACGTSNATNEWFCNKCGKNLVTERYKTISRTPSVHPNPKIEPGGVNRPAPQPAVNRSAWVRCAKCGLDNSASQFLCAQCGARLK